MPPKGSWASRQKAAKLKKERNRKHAAKANAAKSAATTVNDDHAGHEGGHTQDDMPDLGSDSDDDGDTVNEHVHSLPERNEPKRGEGGAQRPHNRRSHVQDLSRNHAVPPAHAPLLGPLAGQTFIARLLARDDYRMQDACSTSEDEDDAVSGMATLY